MTMPPTMPEPKYLSPQDLRKGRRHRTMQASAFIVLTICLIYTVFIGIFSNYPSTSIGRSTLSWIHRNQPISDVVAPALEPRGRLSETIREEVAIYRHVLAASLLIAILSFVGSRKHWRLWATLMRGALNRKYRETAKVHRVVSTSKGQMILGIFAVAFIALFGDFQLGDVTSYFYAHSWTLVRAPVLVAVGYYLACLAITLRYVDPAFNPRP